MGLCFYKLFESFVLVLLFMILLICELKRNGKIDYLLLKLNAATVVDLKPNEHTSTFEINTCRFLSESPRVRISSTIKNNRVVRHSTVIHVLSFSHGNSQNMAPGDV
jgi:hypothetical protein